MKTLLIILYTFITIPITQPIELNGEQYKVYKFGIIHHVKWTKRECQSVLYHRYWIGMNYWMLVYERGKPNTITRLNYGDNSEVEYCWYDYTPSCFYDHDGDDIINAYK